MKIKPRKVTALLLAGLLNVGAMTGLSVDAFAEESVDTNSYVLKYEGEGAKPYMYGSRYEFKHSYNDPEAGESSVWTYYNCPEIFNLVNTYGEGSIAVYCTDADTSTESDTNYRRINLEDSTYHADGSAQKLRSIILNTFPKKSVEEVAADAARAGYEVSELSQGELISATQQAIWESTHGEKYTVDIHYTGIRSMNSYDENEFVYPDSLEAQESDHTASNMEQLYNYFMSLEGTAPITDAVSEYTFENVYYDAAKQTDGTYTMTVTFDINTVIEEKDKLTLSAACGDEVYTEALSAGTHTFSFTGCEDATAVTLEINGYEQGGDVYLFDAYGERTVSQSLVGYDNSELPVHAELTLAPDRTLSIYKTTGDDEKTPLSNIQFEIYNVGTLQDYISGKLAVGAVPTESDIEKYATEENLITTLTTDSYGYAFWNFGQTDGVYLVRELENPAVSEPVAPFFICVSTPDPDTLELDYTVEIYPKNTVITEQVEIEKDVSEIDCDHGTFDVGETHTWIIQSSIPYGMADAQKYEISDTLDYRLSYKGNIVVTVAKTDDRAHVESVVLVEGTDYTVETGTDEVGSNIVDTFKVSLSAQGMKKAADTAVSDTASVYEVRVYFDAVINTKAELGTEIPNQAHIDYTNNVGLEYEDDSDRPEVHTGGLNVKKIDAANGDALSGAVFKIARPISDGGSAELTVTVNGEEIGLVYVGFYMDEDMEGDKVYEVATAEDGTALIYGLSFGDYYLVESKAPEGYNKLSAPVAVEITANSHITDDAEGGYVTVKNSSEFILPETGGMGTAIFTVIGLSLIGAAAAVYFVTGKKKSN